MRTTPSKITAAALLLLIAGASPAQDERIRGVVTDPAGQNLSGVAVSLAKAGNSTTTGPDGSWTLGSTTGVDNSRRQPGLSPVGGTMESRRLAVEFDGFDATGRKALQTDAARVRGRFAARSQGWSDTLVFALGRRTVRVPLDAIPGQPLSTILDTSGIQAMSLRASRFTWSGLPAMSIGIVNLDSKSYDSLRIRLFLNGTASDLADFAARIDIAFSYRADGFVEPGLFSMLGQITRSRPRPLDPDCPATSVCAWSFDLPMMGSTLAPQARWRLDAVFDRHNLARDTTELLNLPPTHDPWSGSDWSFRRHETGNGSPVAYPGIPLADKNAIDDTPYAIPENPYIAIYRGEQLLYGHTPAP